MFAVLLLATCPFMQADDDEEPERIDSTSS